MSGPCQDAAAVAPHSGLSLHGMAVWRDGVLAVMFLAGFAASCGNAPALAMEQQPTHACGGGEVARGTVVVDGRTFVLGDRREVRLAAIEVPSVPLPQDSAGSPGGRAAADALNALAGGDQVMLYGRLVAYAYTMRDGDELFVEGELTGDGCARVSDRVGRGCAGELLGRERAALKARLGLWADPYYYVLSVETPVDVPAQRGRFALVEGKVSVRTRKRRHDLREFRTAAVSGYYSYGPETKRAHIRGGRSRFKESRGPPHSGPRRDGATWQRRPRFPRGRRPEQIESTNGE